MFSLSQMCAVFSWVNFSPNSTAVNYIDDQSSTRADRMEERRRVHKSTLGRRWQDLRQQETLLLYPKLVHQSRLLLFLNTCAPLLDRLLPQRTGHQWVSPNTPHLPVHPTQSSIPRAPRRQASPHQCKPQPTMRRHSDHSKRPQPEQAPVNQFLDSLHNQDNPRSGRASSNSKYLPHKPL